MFLIHGIEFRLDASPLLLIVLRLLLLMNQEDLPFLEVRELHRKLDVVPDSLRIVLAIDEYFGAEVIVG